MSGIDADFQTNRQKVGEEDGVAVWGPVEKPGKLGIHGTNVAVDWDICTGDNACVDACPESVFTMVDTPGHSLSDKKAAPSKEESCIFCMACESACPVEAIKVTPQ